jgi:hypothetical protein
VNVARAVCLLCVLLGACHLPRPTLGDAPPRSDGMVTRLDRPVGGQGAAADCSGDGMDARAAAGSPDGADATGQEQPQRAAAPGHGRVRFEQRLVKEVVVELPPDAVAALESALELVRSGRLAVGIAALEALHAEHPSAVRRALATVLHQQALVHYGRGELREAEAVWERVVAVDPSHPTARGYSAVVRTERLATPAR